MKNSLSIIMFIAVVANTMGCVATNSQTGIYEFGGADLHNIDMSRFTIEEFKKQTACDHTSQCKFVPYGKGLCNPYKGYLIYSTAIGEKNEQHLIDEVKNNRESEIEAQKNSPAIEEICLPSFRFEPLLFCRERDNNSTCLDAVEVMRDQEKKIRKLRGKIDLNNQN